MIIIDNYVGVLRKYAVFSGRATRSEYWMFVLVNVIVQIVLRIVASVLMLVSGIALEIAGSDLSLPAITIIGAVMNVISAVYGLAVLLPALAVMVRRLHDGGYSGWLGLLMLVPIIGWIALLVFMVLPSERGDNKHGPYPHMADV